MSKPSDVWDRPLRLIPFGEAREREASSDELSDLKRHLLEVVGSPLERYVRLAERVLASRALNGSEEKALASEISSMSKALKNAREAGNVEAAVIAAFWIGRLAERTHWRFDNVRGLRGPKVSPEDIVRKSKPGLIGLHANTHAKDEANKARAQKRAEAVRYAHELAATLRAKRANSTDASVSQIARDVRRLWKMNGKRPALSTIRQYLRK